VNRVVEPQEELDAIAFGGERGAERLESLELHGVLDGERHQRRDLLHHGHGRIVVAGGISAGRRRVRRAGREVSSAEPRR
jgi:hypothetical protein